MDNSHLTRSELLSHDSGKEAAHQNLLSEAVDFMKNHPVETVVAGAAIVGGLYNASKLAGVGMRQGEKDIAANLKAEFGDFLKNTPRTNRDFANAYFKPGANGEPAEIVYGGHAEAGQMSDILAQESTVPRHVISGDFNFGPGGLDHESARIRDYHLGKGNDFDFPPPEDPGNMLFGGHESHIDTAELFQHSEWLKRRTPGGARMSKLRVIDPIASRTAPIEQTVVDGDLGAHLHPDLSARSIALSDHLALTGNFDLKAVSRNAEQTAASAAEANVVDLAQGDLGAHLHPALQAAREAAKLTPPIRYILYSEPESATRNAALSELLPHTSDMPALTRPCRLQDMPLRMGRFTEVTSAGMETHLNSLTNTAEGQAALRELAHSVNFRNLVAQEKGRWQEFQPDKPFQFWSEAPSKWEQFVKKELGEGFVEKVQARTWTDTDRAIHKMLSPEGTK